MEKQKDLEGLEEVREAYKSITAKHRAITKNRFDYSSKIISETPTRTVHQITGDCKKLKARVNIGRIHCVYQRLDGGGHHTSVLTSYDSTSPYEFYGME